MRRMAASLGILLLLLSGCVKKNDRIKVVPVKGTLLYHRRNGEPVPMKGARVVFNPVNLENVNAPWPSALVDSGGSFKLGTYDTEDGAPEGMYTVTVEWKEQVTPKYDVTGRGTVSRGPDKLKGKYSDRKTSPLRATVVAGQELTIIIPAS